MHKGNGLMFLQLENETTQPIMSAKPPIARISPKPINPTLNPGPKSLNNKKPPQPAMLMLSKRPVNNKISLTTNGIKMLDLSPRSTTAATPPGTSAPSTKMKISFARSTAAIFLLRTSVS
jgi:hypothetical protein